MKILLDTHVWLWAILQPQKLERKAQREIENPKNERYLSPISIWEAHHVIRKKRLRVDRAPSEWLVRALDQIPVQEAPFSFVVAVETGRIELPHNDPADLIIAATASVYGLTLVTADEQLLRCSWLKTLAC